MPESNPIWVLSLNGLLTRGYCLEQYEFVATHPSGAVKVKKNGHPMTIRQRPGQFFFRESAPLVEKIRELLSMLVAEDKQRVSVRENVLAKTDEELLQRAIVHPAERPTYMDEPLEVD